jgi:hypothetical protein
LCVAAVAVFDENRGNQLRITLIAAALVAVPLLAGCGSSNAQPEVTQADLSKALQSSGLNDPKLADCAAKIYVGEGISQDGLRLMTKPGTDTNKLDSARPGSAIRLGSPSRDGAGFTRLLVLILPYRLSCAGGASRGLSSSPRP